MAALLQQAAAAGIAPGDSAAGMLDADDGEELYLWPENVPAWDAFVGLSDQWSDGVLPRSEILAHIQFSEPDAARQRQLYEGVLACSRAVREVHAKHRKVEERRRRAEAERRRLERSR